MPAGDGAREAVLELTGGEGADLVVDATGFPDSFGPAVSMARDGGTVIEVGAFVDMGDASFNPAVLCGRNLALLGIAGEDLLVYEGSLALMARHHETVPFADMVSHRFGVEEAPAGHGARARRRRVGQGAHRPRAVRGRLKFGRRVATALRAA